MSVNDEQAQMNWARYFLPLYRSIRRQDRACLDAFLYGLFAAYTDRFRGTLCAKLGTPTADLRDPTSLGQWRRKALKMLSDLLRHLDVTEPTTSLPLPPPSSASLAIDSSSSNVPENATASGAITSSLPTPRLILVPQLRRSVRLVGKSRDTTQDTSASVEHTPTSMAAVIAQQDDSVNSPMLMHFIGLYCYQMPGRKVFPPEQDQFLQNRLVPECFKTFIDAYPLPNASEETRNRRKKQMSSRIYRCLHSRNMTTRGKAKEILRPKRKRARNVFEIYLNSVCNNKDEGFAAAVREEVAKEEAKALGIAMDHPDVANNDHDQSDTMAQPDTTTTSNIDSNETSRATKVPRKSAKVLRDGKILQIKRRVAKEHLATEPPEVQRELQRIAEKEAKEIRDMRSRDPNNVTTQRVFSMIDDLEPLMQQLSQLLGEIGWSFTFLAGGFEPGGEGPRTFIMNYGWNDKNQDFRTWHRDFDTHVHNAFKDFLLTIYTPERRVEFESSLKKAEEARQEAEEQDEAVNQQEAEENNGAVDQQETEEDNNTVNKRGEGAADAGVDANQQEMSDALVQHCRPPTWLEGSATDVSNRDGCQNDTQGSEAEEIHMFVSPSDLQLHGPGAPHQRDLASLSGPLPNFTTNSNASLSLAINTSIVPNASEAHADLLPVSVPEDLVSSASPNLLMTSGASTRTFSTFPLGGEIDPQWMGSSSWVDTWSPYLGFDGVNTSELDLSFFDTGEGDKTPGFNIPLSSEPLERWNESVNTPDILQGSYMSSVPSVHVNDNSDINIQLPSLSAFRSHSLAVGSSADLSPFQGSPINPNRNISPLRNDRVPPSVEERTMNLTLERILRPHVRLEEHPRVTMRKDVSVKISDSEKIFLSAGLGSAFDNCVKLWMKFELCSAISKDRLCLDKQPVVLTKYLSAKKLRPDLPELSMEQQHSLISELQRWWEDIRPVYRPTNTSGDLPIADYASLKKKGSYGMMQVMHALRWWGTLKSEMALWTTLVSEVSDCFSVMLEGADKGELRDKNVKRGSDRNKPSRKQTRRR
ncbi:hypothetical protein EDD18DRAFT_1367419 [Armillaria luteobubalina]|uniref:Uncharacterized protein n=1 Tax=Armillaria luteobubalina TaxID=153913 RepID=A0AA39P0X3_9AGAR|nr:hypothetical protein EDD18DRAFT_1367419 [Armillaria luteobubalina]